MDDRNQLADLLARTALGDREAFRALYARTSAKLFGVALRILGNRSEAEDALQDIYIKIWQRADGFRPDAAAPMTWLIAIGRNHAIDRVRARKPQASDIDTALAIADPGPTPEQSAVNTGERWRIEGCLDKLDERKAEAVRCAYVEGQSYNDLAARFDVPLNTIRTWLRRSLLQLRECLGQ